MKTAGIVPTEAEEGLFPGRTAGQSAKSGSELITSRSQGGISRRRERKPVSGCRIPGALPHYQSGHGRVPEKKSGRQRMNFTDNHSALLLRRTPLPAFRDYAGAEPSEISWSARRGQRYFSCDSLLCAFLLSREDRSAASEQ